MSDPWAAPREPRGFRLGCLPVAWLALVLALLGGVAFSFLYEGKEDIERAIEDGREARSFGTEIDRALDGPPDTATVPPAADGSRRYDSPAPERGDSAFRLRLPRGWEARHVGAREGSTRYLDTILTYRDDVMLIVDRVDYAPQAGTDEFLRKLARDLAQRQRPVRVGSRFQPATVGGGGGTAYRVDGSAEGIGVYLVVFDRGLETFRILVITPPAMSREAADQVVQPVLDSWRWG